jgi:hypothetical protein
MVKLIQTVPHTTVLNEDPIYVGERKANALAVKEILPSKLQTKTDK